MIKNEEETKSVDFIREIVNKDMESEKWGGRVHTRFPPEPNGYLHIGHARNICLNFILADEYGGLYNLRFDDTNPVSEETEYVESMIKDIHWLGFDWGDRLFYASNYFPQLYDFAVELIKRGKAYVCDLTEEEIRATRGTVKEHGKESPYRVRSIEENLDLFERMRDGEFKDGEKTLRAKIDMTHPNMKMRDPVMYRIRHITHHRTGDKWCIYPMYDFTHCLSDSIEGITHSICTLEFDVNRPLYDWYLDQLEAYHPQQIEAARVNLSHTILSKRKLLQLVEKGFVNGWSDPRMPTLSGLRRRGYTPASIREFSDRVGVGRSEGTAEMALLEFCIRQELNFSATRVMVVLRPVKLIIDNYPEGKVEMMEAINNPEDPEAGTRMLPFSKEMYVELDDFREDPPKKWFRLAPGKEVRLKHAYYVTVTDVVKDEKTGEITELHCTYDPESRGGGTPDMRKVRGTIHWVSADHAVDAEVRLYNNLFTVPEPMGEEGEYTDYINPTSLEVLEGCKMEPGLINAKTGEKFQFMRKGYFCVDPDSTDKMKVFNRTVTLRDSWAKIEKKLKRRL
ncbi:MAG: glutamine--tRNA ligase/YqeY domain fusion protein [Candidatus Eremiobacteraeota bacterium]|nr:glutamine--tRNA ligase/YqeY domain fusion protein [Candidatus Eremiobacteraeota bacterium]